jgi:hypothetical protein
MNQALYAHMNNKRKMKKKYCAEKGDLYHTLLGGHITLSLKQVHF